MALVFSIFLVSCEENDDKSENIFQFNLSNSYRIENTGEQFETPNGFGIQDPNPFAMVITDGDIDGELTTPCCNSVWGYKINPSTIVSIVFQESKNDLSSGIYTYNRDSVENDFELRIFNEMHFNDKNELISQQTIAYEHATLNEEGIIQNAQLELLLGEVVVELNYVIETITNERIAGSYLGPLENFTYSFCNADCD